MADFRLIDANVLPNYKCQVTATVGDQKGPAEMRFVFWQDIEKAPTIDAVPVVNGRWSEPFIGGYDGLHAVYYMTCSKCMGEVRHSIFRYCPNCGAKMDEKE